MAASFYDAQFALKLCENHDEKELMGYCNTCKQKVCSSCIKEDHTSHDWETITDILREKKRTLPGECKEIRAKQLPNLKKELSRFDRKIEDENTRFEQNRSTLNTSRQSYVNEINRLFDERIMECHQKSEEVTNSYKETRDALKQKIEYLQMMTTSLDKDINTLPDHDIIEMEKEMRDELEKALSYSADKYTCTTVFVSGIMDNQALADMVGEAHIVFVEEKHDIDRFSDSIMSAKPVSETSAWVLTNGVSQPKLLDIKGEEVKTIKTSCTDLVIVDDGELFVLTMKSKCKVSVRSEYNDIICTTGTQPLIPTFISNTEDDDILVTLRDDGDKYDLLPTSRRLVQRMTPEGEVLNTYEFKDDGQTRLFTYPARTTENKNSDVCVVNWLNGSSELVVLFQDGRVKLTYKGDGLRSYKFVICDVECDSKCRILFTEKYSKAIQMLTTEGMYLCALCQYERVRPYVISIHGEDL